MYFRKAGRNETGGLEASGSDSAWSTTLREAVAPGPARSSRGGGYHSHVPRRKPSRRPTTLGSTGVQDKVSLYVSKQKSLGITIRYINYHNFDLIRSPLLATSFLHRIGISAILTRISSSVILSHSSKITYFSSSIVRQSPYRFLTRCFPRN